MKKHSWVFGICTLVLCLGTMLFGVYSAISASLNVSGTLGFNMHNAVVGVSGTIYNLSELDKSGTYASKVNKTINRAIMGGESTTTTTIEIGDMYFFYGSDETTGEGKLFDIIFQITFTNMGETAIQATIPLPAVESGVTIIHGATTNSGYSDLTDLTSYTPVIKMGASVTVKFALRLNDASQTLSEVAFNWLNISFVETEELFYTITETEDACAGFLATKMGHAVNDASLELEWIAFAVKDENINNSFHTYFNSSKYYSLLGYDTSNLDYSGKTFLFISRYVLDYMSVYGTNNAYSTSQINSYLTSSANDGFISQTNVSTSAVYLNGIIDPITVSGDDGFSNAKFWLPYSSFLDILDSGSSSVNKPVNSLNAFLAVDPPSSTTYSEPRIAYKVGTTSLAEWWIIGGLQVQVTKLQQYVGVDGCNYRENNFSTNKKGIRPICQITIP